MGTEHLIRLANLLEGRIGDLEIESISVVADHQNTGRENFAKLITVSIAPHNAATGRRHVQELFDATIQLRITGAVLAALTGSHHRRLTGESVAGHRQRIGHRRYLGGHGHNRKIWVGWVLWGFKSIRCVSHRGRVSPWTGLLANNGRPVVDTRARVLRQGRHTGAATLLHRDR